MKTINLLQILALLIFSIHVNAQTWTTINSGTTNDIWGISFVDDNTGWISCSGGKIFKTTDGGANWSSQNSGQTTPILRNVNMFDQNIGWVVGDNGLILKTTDGGSTWNPQTSGSTQALRKITFASASEIWVCGGNGTILHTTDGGTNWQTQTSNTTIGLMNMEFVDANNGWAVGSSGGANIGIILHSTDGGTTWNPQTFPNNVNLNTCSYFDAAHGWVAGNSGEIFHTIDGGANWILETTNVTTIFRIIKFTSNLIGWAGDDSGNILHTTDGGMTWSIQTSGGGQFFRGINFLNSNYGFAVGNSGALLKFTSPLVNVSGTITSYTTNVGVASGTQNFTVSGDYLSTNIQLTAPNDFEISLSASSGFGSTLNLPQTNGKVLATTIYVRYNPAVAGNHNGNLTVVTGNLTQNIMLSGSSTNANVSDLTNEIITIYPNPSRGVFEIKGISENIESIQIFSQDGRTVFEKNEFANNNIDLSTFDNGTYQLKITTKTNQSTKRIVIVK